MKPYVCAFLAAAILVTAGPAFADVAGAVQGGTQWIITIVRVMAIGVVIFFALSVLSGRGNWMQIVAGLCAIVVASNPEEVVAFLGI